MNFPFQGGEVISNREEVENEVMRSYRDLEIHYARYGSNVHKRSVVGCLQDKISVHNRLNLLVSNDNFGGDFYSGQAKQLHVIYTFNGVLHEEKLDEGEVLVIPKQSSNAMSDIVPTSILLGILLDKVGVGLIIVAFAWGVSQIISRWRFDK